jgi:hypothetical protein
MPGTPGQPPSNITLAPPQVDGPIEQDANYEFDSFDRAYIDSQIRGIQQLITSLVTGGVSATIVQLAGNSSAAAVGMAVCSSQQTLPNPQVTLAKTAAMAAASVMGVVISAAAPGGYVAVATTGLLTSAVTGLPSGSAGYAVVNGADGTLAFSASPDGAIGTVDGGGNLTLTPGGAGTSSGAGTFATVNVNATGTGGRSASPYVASAGQRVVVRMTEGAVTVKLPDALGKDQAVQIVVEDGQATGGTLTITTVTGSKTLAQPSPNNGTAITSIAIAAAAANSGLTLTWYNGGSSDGRYLLG